MTTDYSNLLEATIQHLQRLKKGGIRYVEVSSETIAALGRSTVAKPSPRKTIVTPPAPETVKATLPPAIIEAPSLSETEKAAKAAAIKELADRAAVCVKCPHLAASRTKVVFGVGDIHSPLMFVGEAPGADEDLQGEPFVGKAGQLLTKIIQTMGFDRDSVYIANILKCRPDTPGEASGNRKPTPDEVQNCLPYLNAQIDLIKPKVIVALGGTAVEGLFGKLTAGITKLRGQFAEFRGIPVMQTYHPSYLLRPNPVNVKRQTWEDMMQVMERLGLPVSEKQRGYFLSKT